MPLALPTDPIEVVAGLETRLFRRAGVDLRRCEVGADEAQPWSQIRLATRRRTAFDLLLDRALPDAVANLDAALRAGLVGRTEMESYLRDRHDRGIVQARQALALAVFITREHLRDPHRMVYTIRAALQARLAA